MANVAVLAFSMVCCLCLFEGTVSKEVNDKDNIQNLKQRVEFYHEGLKRSLHDLNFALSSFEKPDTGHRSRQKRDSLAQLTQSYFAFCQTLLNTSSSKRNPFKAGSTSNSVSLSSEDENMLTPNATIVPVSVSVSTGKKGNMAIVKFIVQYNRPGTVFPALTSLDLGRIRRKRLQVGLYDKLPKLSTVTFRIKTHWCSDWENPPTVAFWFRSQIPEDPLTSVEVNVCGDKGKPRSTDSGGLSESDEMKETQRALPPVILFRYNTTSPDFRVEKGKNITVVLKFDSDMMQLMREERANIFLNNVDYNTKIGGSFSFFDISDGWRHTEFRIHKSHLKDKVLPLSNFTIVKNIVTSKNHSASSREGHGDYEPENSAGNTAVNSGSEPRYLGITFDTACGETTGIVFISHKILYPPSSGVVRATHIELPFIIRQKDKTSPFPDDFVFPLHDRKQQCELNPRSTVYKYEAGYCRLGCSVFGSSINSVTVSKVEGSSLNPMTNGPSITNTYWVSTVARLGKGKPSFGGKYICKAVTKTGKEIDFDIELLAYGTALIDHEKTFANSTNGDVVFNCDASGTNLSVAIERVGYTHNGQMVVTRIDTNPEFEKLVEFKTNDREAYSLRVPSEYIEKATSDSFLCNATNAYGQESKYYETYGFEGLSANVSTIW